MANHTTTQCDCGKWAVVVCSCAGCLNTWANWYSALLTIADFVIGDKKLDKCVECGAKWPTVSTWYKHGGVKTCKCESCGAEWKLPTK